MLSWPDFKEKQIAYIEAGELKNIVIKNGNMCLKDADSGKIINQLSIHKIFAVFIEGSVTLTSVFIKKVMKEGGMIVLLSRNMMPMCVIGGETEGNFLLREKQYEGKSDLRLSKWLVACKIENQLALLKKIRKKNERLKKSIKELKIILEKVDKQLVSKALLGMEGNASKIFFKEYFSEFGWRGRKPRTKFDEINVLMDIGYTFLFNFIDCNLRLYGFDVYRGFYHTDFYQRKSLVCDIEEVFRCIIDSSLRKMFTLKVFDKKDFKVKNGCYALKSGRSKKYVKCFMEAIMTRKEDIFKFIQSYYRCVMKGNNDYPIFKV